MLCCCLRFAFRVIKCCNVLYRKVMKGNKKVAKNKGVPNERRRLSLRPRTTPIAKTPVIPEGSKKSKNSKKSTQEREPSHISLSVTDESEREGSESERSKKSTPEREPSYQSRSISDESEREGSESETKLEAVDLRLGGIEKNQRLLRCRAKKIEKRLTSIENKVSEKPNHGEDMDFGQCDGTDFGQWDGKEKDDAEEEEKEKSGKEKEKSGEVDKDKENSETDEENDSERELNELKERCRVQADELWREVEAAEAEEDQANDERKEAATNEESIENSEDDEKVEASESPNSEPRFESPINVPRFESPINEPRVEADKTPTPPSGGRTKAMAARRVVVVEAKEKAIEKAVELEKKTSEEVVEAEEKTSEKAVEAEEKTSEKVVERMDGTKEATRPRIRHRCKEKTMTSGKPTPKRRGRPRRSIADAAPKKSDCTPHASKGRGKRKCEPSQWVQTPFTRGKKPKTKA
ncbi:unnamed protein product [Brassica napus]|uniref:(rape) hypothetical protein n=1 Tax=Brassica napus TaxID=3708 RepID=A0A816INT6_BRANA|nr:unnamed protein product [Brassica napus]